MIDYAFHMNVADTGHGNLTEGVPALIAQGHRPIEIFITYEKVRQDDKSILDILNVTKRDGALVYSHAENDGLIRNITEKLLAAGKSAPKFHATSHPREAEIEVIAIWDPTMKHRYSANDLKDNVGYNPFEGTTVTGLPVSVLAQGHSLVTNRLIEGAPCDGRWLAMTSKAQSCPKTGVPALRSC